MTTQKKPRKPSTVLGQAQKCGMLNRLIGYQTLPLTPFDNWAPMTTCIYKH